jgi:hypothetical protein
MDGPMKRKARFDRKITIEPEEYDALMSGLPTPEVDLKPTSNSSKIDEKFRKIEFCMMIIVGLILVVFILCRGH